MADLTSAARLLEALIKAIQNPASRYGQYVERSLLRLLTAEKSNAVALSERSADIQRMADRVAIVEGVIRGMAAMSRVNENVIGDMMKLMKVSLGSNGLTDTLYRAPLAFQEGYLVVLTNISPADCNRVLDNAQLFAPWGKIGIKAIVVAHDLASGATGIGIVLPYRQDRDSEGFTIVTFGNDSRIDACSYSWQEDKPAPTLEQVLGPNCPSGVIVSAGEIDSTVGFPGAADYLPRILPGLERYLAELAADMDSW